MIEITHSETLSMIMRHWHDQLPSEGQIDLPFDVESFCREMDARLAKLEEAVEDASYGAMEAAERAEAYD